MRPYIQSKIHGDGVRGNCLQTALASLIEIEPSKVPSFELMDRTQWKKELIYWLGTQGLAFHQTKTDPMLSDYYIVVGLSELGNRHCVVGMEGRLAHDPDPAQKGLSRAQEFWVISPQPKSSISGM